MNAHKFSDATLQDLVDNPTKFGVPTFEEFSKNPEKYRQKKSYLTFLEALSDQPGVSNLARVLKNLEVVVMGVNFGDNLDKAMTFLDNELSEDDKEKILLRSNMEKNGEGKYTVKAYLATPEWFANRDENLQEKT